MQQFTPQDVTLRVHTRKHGLLSKIAHDLCFETSVASAEFRPDGSGGVRIDPMAIRLLGAERDGVVDREVLSVTDQRRVLANLRQDVLDVRRYPEITYSWTELHVSGPQVRMEGRLRLHGAERPMTLRGGIEAGRVQFIVTLDQRDFGIKPYSAALGALRVHPELQIEVSLPVAAITAAEGAAGAGLEQTVVASTESVTPAGAPAR